MKAKSKERKMEQVVSKNRIEHEVGGVQSDALRFGLNGGVKSEIIQLHPLQSAKNMTQGDVPTHILSTTYGYAFPLKMDLDRQILARFQRPPGALPSSMLGFEAFTGSLDDFDFSDYHCLNDPPESERYRPADMHHGMEVRLGLSKGPVCPSFI